MSSGREVNNVVHKCDIKRPLPKKEYLRSAQGEWKSRFCNMWDLKRETPNLKWSVLR